MLGRNRGFGSPACPALVTEVLSVRAGECLRRYLNLASLDTLLVEDARLLLRNAQPSTLERSREFGRKSIKEIASFMGWDYQTKKPPLSAVEKENVRLKATLKNIGRALARVSSSLDMDA